MRQSRLKVKCKTSFLSVFEGRGYRLRSRYFPHVTETPRKTRHRSPLNLGARQ